MKNTIFKNIKNSKVNLELTGMNGSEKGFVVSQLCQEMDRNIVVILPDHKKAVRFMEDLSFFVPEKASDLLYFPGYHILPFKSLSYHGGTAARRLAVLTHLISGRAHHLVITSVDTLMQKLIPKTIIANAQELILNGEDIDRDLLIARLNAGGYQRTSLVEEPGDYSVRGGIMDIFSPNYEFPLRLDLMGDMVESLRFFSPISQRGTRELTEAIIIPANEAVVARTELTHVLGRLRQAASESDIGTAKMREYVERTKEEGRFPGMESMLSIVYPQLDSFFDYAGNDALFVMDEPDVLEQAAHKFEKSAQDNFDTARNENRLCVAPESIYMTWEDVTTHISDKKTMALKALDIQKNSPKAPRVQVMHPGFQNNAMLSSELKREDRHENILLPLAKWLQEKQDLGMAAMMVCTSDVQATRIVSLLQPYGIIPSRLEQFPHERRPAPGIFCVVGNISSGFVHSKEGLALITDQEIFGAKKRIRKPGTRRAKTHFITPEELKEGDIVVHVEHGLGRYEGLRTIAMEGISGDFILISYRDEDRLYLPVDRMEMVEKYVGVEGYAPILDKIGGKTWGKARAKAKKEVEKMAGELLKIYAERRVNKGHAFSPSDTYYNDFEAAFPYDETPDQLKAIDDVLTDMENETPMDRLVCGDVGYGKTEVAIRATFKAVNDGKQVAVVVPTTILAEQHLHTFRERFAAYPVTVEALSRFRTAAEQRKILTNLAQGRTDVVIGTHRLLQKDVHFKAMGLLVIDEEQRFGVKHKEALKKRRTTIDVLALTATPIPRTLHMSLTGMRDISVISTPPEDRQPIVSYISEYDDSIVADAVKREIARGGQIFFIHNEIKTIFKIAENLEKLIPQLRLGVAHGRLSESNLEKVMLQFINKEIDLLVCTTIVESGLDIPSANTMIINKADRFGLAQIYQLRGRIGRGDEQAYAYMFIPDENRLTRDAKKRLAALMEHRDLGSGFQIAMKDLQIRGSGSALGGAQSGHIAAVGYDMFLKLLDEAVSDLKGTPVVESLEPEINIAMSAHISDEYVKSIEQRLTVYRRLSQMTEPAQVLAMQKELIDRFGKLPEEGVNMLFKIMLRVLSIKAGVKKMDITNTGISMVFSDLHQKKSSGLAGAVSQISLPHKFTSENVLKITVGTRIKKITKALVEARKILKLIAARVN
ncbi:transcription-repair coupling factor [Desulfocicer vacuolatum]|nr:transcription-repair coupling factor [Desulfocicer vacuolatum]